MNCLKMACNSKTAKQLAIDQNGVIWDSWIVVTCIRGYLKPLMFKVIWGHSMHLSQNGLQLTADVQKGVNIWDSGVGLTRTWGDLLMFNVILVCLSQNGL